MTVETVLSHPIVPRLGWTLVHFVWQGAAVAVLLAVVMLLLRRRSANARYVAACAALALMAALPLVTMRMVPVSSGVVMEEPTAAPASADLRVKMPSEVAVPASVAPADYERSGIPRGSVAVPPVTSHRGLPWWERASQLFQPTLPWIVCGWLTGVLALSLRLLGGWAQAQHLKRRFVRPASDRWREVLADLARRLRVSRPVRLMESTLARVPTVVGWFRPVILLPAGVMTGLSPQQVEALIAHELAHIRRYDYLANLLQTVIETLLFYHPAVWWVSHRIRVEREHCCDDLAVATCDDAVSYARALAELEQLRGERARLAIASSGGSLIERVRRLVGASVSHTNRSAWWLAGVIAVAVIIAMATAVQISGSPAEVGESSTTGPGEVVNGLQVSIVAEKAEYALDEPVTVRWRIENVGGEDRTVFWVTHFRSTDFLLGVFFQASTDPAPRSDYRGMDTGPGRCKLDEILLRPGDVKETTVDLRRYGINEPGQYRIRGTYAPREDEMLPRLVHPQVPDWSRGFADRLESGEIDISIVEDLSWLWSQVRTAEFRDRMRAARRLAVLGESEAVLPELEKMYPPEDTRHMVFLVYLMAELGDLSHVDEVVDMYEHGGYAPHWEDYGEDILVFLVRWGGERGARQLQRYLTEHRITEDGTSEHSRKRRLMKALVSGDTMWWEDFEVEETALPLLVMALDERQAHGKRRVKTEPEAVYVDMRWCDDAALAIQRVVDRDWGMRLDLPEPERDAIISRMREELAGTVHTLPPRTPAAGQDTARPGVPEQDGEADQRPVWVTLMPRSPIRTLKEYHHTFRARSLVSEGAEITSCEFEIRSASDNVQIARFPYVAGTGTLSLRDALAPGKVFEGIPHYGGGILTESERRRIEPLTDGDYLIALIVNGVRCSNVAQLTIDSDFDPQTEPTLKLIPLDAGPGLSLPYLGVRAIGPTPQDPELTNYAVAFPQIFVDGVERKIGMILWTGPVGPLQPGQVHKRILDISANLDPPIEPGEPHEIYVKVGKYESAPIRVPTKDELAEIWERRPSLRIAEPMPRLMLIGRVLGPDGRPAKGYNVTLEAGSGERYEQMSDARGDYRFLDIPAGTYDVTCRRPSRVGPTLTVQQVRLDQKEPVVLDLPLEQKFEIGGRVIYEDGLPAAGIHVVGTWESPQLYDSFFTRGKFTDTAVTDERGEYVLSGPIEFVERVAIDGPTYKGRSPLPYTSSMAGSRHVDFRLRRDGSQAEPATFPGVMDLQVLHQHTNAPLSGVELEYKRDLYKTDGEGLCRIPLPADEPSYLGIVARKSGFVPMEIRFSEEYGRGWQQIPRSYTLWMEPGTLIGGTVQDEGGKPIRGATLYLRAGSFAGRYHDRPKILDYPVTTDADGRWRCDIMPSRLNRIRIFKVEHPDHVALHYPDVPDLSVGQFREMTGVIVMKEGLAFQGTVADFEGRAIAGANVRLDPIVDGSLAGHIATTTDETGYFRFEHARFGDAILTVTAAEYAPELKHVVVAKWTEDQQIRLGAAQTISGTVVDEQGRPVADASVHARKWRGRHTLGWHGKTDAEGRFRWDEAPGSRVEFWISKAGFRGTKATLTSSAGGQTIVLVYSETSATRAREAGQDTAREAVRKLRNESEPVLSLTIQCEEREFKVGDEIGITFVVKNEGNSHYTYGDRNRDRSGRMPEYELSAVDEEGNALPDPLAKLLGPFGGGLASIRTLAPGESFTKTIALSQWALLTEPGTYEVTGTYTYRYAGRRQYYGESGRVLSPPIRIKLRPLTDDEMVATDPHVDTEGVHTNRETAREAIKARRERLKGEHVPATEQKPPAEPVAEEKVVNISIFDHHPLDVSVIELRVQHGVQVSYETVRCAYAGDLEERAITNPSTGVTHRDFVPRKGRVDLSYAVSNETNRLVDPLGALEELCRVHEMNGNPGRFEVRTLGSMFCIVPTMVRNEEGDWQKARPVLDTVVSFPKEERTALETISLLLNEVEKIVQKDFPEEVVGMFRIPLNRFTQTELSIGASNECARDVLVRVLNQVEGKFSYAVGYATNPKRNSSLMCIDFVREPEKPGAPRDAFTPTEGGGAAVTSEETRSAASENVSREVRQMLAQHPRIVFDESRPDIPDDMRERVVALQPASGNALLEIIADPEDELNRQATNVLIKVWNSLSPRQIETYLKAAMTAYVEGRAKYPQGKKAYVATGYQIRYGWGGWPEVDDITMRTDSYRTVDGGQYGRRVSYEGHQARTGGVPLEDFDLGAHKVRAVTEYEVSYKGGTYSGRVESPVAEFEIVQPFGRNAMVAAEDPELDKLVRRSFHFMETDADLVESTDRYEDPWEPQISGWKMGEPGEFAVHMPLYEVTEPLPVDLCFDVEFHLEETGEVFAGDGFVVRQKVTREGYLSPRRVREFLEGKEDFIPLKVVLTPSRETALSRTGVTEYWGGTIKSPVMRAKAYWYPEDSAAPWLIELRAKLEELKASETLDEEILNVIDGLVSLNPHRRARHAWAAPRWLSGDDMTPVLPFLTGLLADTDTDLPVQPAERARQALIEIGDERAIPALEGMAATDPHVDAEGVHTNRETAREQEDMRDTRLRYEVELHYEDEIVVGGEIVLRCHLVNVGDKPMRVFWGDRAYEDQYCFSITRTDGMELATPGRSFMPTPASLPPKSFTTVLPGAKVEYSVFLNQGPGRNGQLHFFREPGEYVVRPSFQSWMMPVSTDPDAKVDPGKAVRTGLLEAEPISVRIVASDRRVLPDWTRIEGRVTDPSGARLVGGEVLILRQRGPPPLSGGAAASAYRPVTDRAGRFVVSREPDDSFPSKEVHVEAMVRDSRGERLVGAQVVVTEYEISPALQSVVSPPVLEPLVTDERGMGIFRRVLEETSMPAGIRIEGQLVDSNGTPIPDARLFANRCVVSPGGDRWDERFCESALDRQASDAAGAFAFSHLPADSPFYTIACRHPQYGAARVRIVMRPPVTRYDVRIELAAPDADADVTQWQPVAASVDVTPHEPVATRPPAESRADPLAKPEFLRSGYGWVTGRIMYEDGTPALGAGGVEPFAVKMVDSDGRFSIGLPAGEGMARIDLARAICWPRIPEDGPDTPARYLPLAVMGGIMVPGGVYLHAWVPADVTVGEPVTVPHIVLNRDQLTTLRVKCDPDLFLSPDKAGRVAQWGPKVTLLVDTGHYYLTYDVVHDIDRDVDRPIHWTSDDEFVIEDVPAGKKMLLLSGGDLLWYQTVEEGAGDPELTFGPVSTETVEGHVVDTDGNPVEGAGVIARCAEFPLPRSGPHVLHVSTWVGTGADGSFRFRLGSGRYLVYEGEAGDTTGTLVDVKPGATPHIRLIVDSASAETGEDDASSEPGEPWGDPVEGVQCRLRAEKTVWREGETLTFKADVRNQGTLDLLIWQTQIMCEIEVDGEWYIMGHAKLAVKSSWFPPGREYSGIVFSLDQPWVSRQGRQPLNIDLREHVIRVAFTAHVRESDHPPVTAISNPIELEIRREGAGKSPPAADSLRRD